MAVTKSQNWTEIIEPKYSLLDLKLDELWRYKDLILLFVRRDFVARYKQTILGPLWFVIQPLFTTLIFTVVFGNIAGISTDGMPPVLFYMSGIVAWNYFAECLKQTATTFKDNAPMFGKVYFPRLVTPLSIVISNLVTFSIQFLFLLGFIGYFYTEGVAIQPKASVIIIPLLVGLIALMGLGFGLIISALTTKYRDLVQLLTFGVQLAMYATPIIYPLTEVPEKYRVLVLANPMSAVIEAFRYCLLGVGSLELGNILYSVGFTLILLLVGILVFNRVEKTFMDTV